MASDESEPRRTRAQPEQGPHWRAWVRERLSRGHGFRLAVRVLLVPVLVVLVVLAWLSVVGFPAPVTDAFLERMHQLGAVTKVHRLRFDLLEGITAEDVAFYTEEDLSLPLIEARQVVLRLDVFEGLSGGQALKGLRIRDGVCRLAAEGTLAVAKTNRQLALRNVDADLQFERGGVRVASMRGHLFGIRIDGRGFVVGALGHPSEGLDARPILRRPLAVIAEAVPEWLPQLVEQLNDISFIDEARANLEFTWYPKDAALTEATFTAQGGRTRCRGVLFDRWRAEASFDDLRLSAPRVELEADGRELTLDGFLDLDTRTSAVHIVSDLPTPHCTSLIPMAWRDRWDQSGYRFFDPVACNIQFGPAEVGRLSACFTGTCSFGDAEFRGVRLDRGEAAFSRRNASLVLTNVLAVLGRDAGRGPAHGWLSYNLTNGVSRGALNGHFDPHAFLPALTQRQQRPLRRLRFDEQPPVFDIAFGGRRGVPEAFYWSGALRATNFFYNGVFINSFTAPAVLTNEVFTLSPMRVHRPEGRLEGEVHIDFERDLATLDVVNTADPKMVARALGPNTERMFRLFRAEGPSHAIVKGVVDLATNGMTRLDVSAVATNFGIKWFLADRCRFDVRAVGDEIAVTHIAGTMYGGSFEAAAFFRNMEERTNRAYDVAFAFTNLSLADVVAQLRQTDTDPYRGSFSGTGRVAGVMGPGRSDTVTGGGRISVRDGYLFKIPLLGGLSSMLSLLTPKWDFAAQTDCSARYVFADRRALSDDIRIDGKLIRLTAKGRYGFNGKLDFDVKVKPQGEGVIAELVQILTSPVTMLLAFHLGGTLEDPSWRPENLPKELFLKR